MDCGYPRNRKKTDKKVLGDVVVDSLIEYFFTCMQAYRLGLDSSKGDATYKNICLKHFKGFVKKIKT